MPEEIVSGIYRIPVPLVGNPLKELNAYLLKGADGNLLIDTGFRQPACRWLPIHTVPPPRNR